MPRLLTGHTLLRFNLLQGMKTKQHAGFFNYLILLNKLDFRAVFSDIAKAQTLV